MIAHGLKRLAERDPGAASKSWLSYEDSHRFDAEHVAEIEAALVIGHARQGRFPEHQAELNPAPAESLALAARNLPDTKVVSGQGLSVYDVLLYDNLLTSQAGITRIDEALR